MSASLDHREGPTPDDPSSALTDLPNQLSRRRELSRSFRKTVLFLIVSAIVYCLVVVQQRDTRTKDEGMRWAKGVAADLQKILDERKFLPQKFPDGHEIENGTPFVPYPSPEEVSRLELEEQPFLVVSGPRKGLIMPGRDGCACVMFDAGKVTAAWLSVPEVKAAQQRRQQLLAGSTDQG
ncbi:MAG TPA: hypothetical protein PKN33_11420 [Phycisphaerae bacterium]|nr:hypothetical protein [Phycisphaerae bacterium]